MKYSVVLLTAFTYVSAICSIASAATNIEGGGLGTETMTLPGTICGCGIETAPDGEETGVVLNCNPGGMIKEWNVPQDAASIDEAMVKCRVFEAAGGY